MKSNSWDRILSFLFDTPWRAAVTPYVITAIATIGISWILPLSTLANGGGVIAFVVLVVCAWYLGLGPSIVAPLLLVVSFRFRGGGFQNILVFSSKDLLDVSTITIVTVAVGISGVFRRRSQSIAHKRAIQLQDQDRRKDEFLATLAHELRNPLAPICTGLEVLRVIGLQSGQATAAQDVHQMMQRQIDHMVRLINNLLDVSRINTGKIEIRRELVALADVVDDAVEVSRPHIDEAQHNLSITIP